MSLLKDQEPGHIKINRIVEEKATKKLQEASEASRRKQKETANYVAEAYPEILSGLRQKAYTEFSLELLHVAGADAIGLVEDINEKRNENVSFLDAAYDIMDAYEQRKDLVNKYKNNSQKKDS